jgi:hypothetical protein
MRSVWIIGAGQFGAHAVAAARRQTPVVDITLVDCDANQLQGWPPMVNTVCDDGIAFLTRRFARGDVPAMIVPAAPIHIAYAWTRRALKAQTELVAQPIPDTIAARLPNPIQGANGELFVSHADSLCPPNCSEPTDRCTATGRRRPKDMFRLLGELEIDGYASVVVRSLQMAPGVGGYSPETLFAACTAVARSNGPVLLATACRCHAVMHAVHVRSLATPQTAEP